MDFGTKPYGLSEFLKRAFDITFVLLAVPLLLPTFLVIAVLIKMDSVGSVFFLQNRVGLKRQLFLIHKFRTMVIDTSIESLQITAMGDPRVTRVGAFLRKHKLDELPQLFDVLRGKMSLVGPRPEVPKYVSIYPEYAREVIFSVKPGITDNASLLFFDEERQLSESSSPEQFYVSIVLPKKIQCHIEYVNNRGFISDIRIILRTIARLIH